MRDDRIGQWEKHRLRYELLAPHVVGELEIGRLWSLGDDEAVACAGEHVDEPLHEIDVGRAEAAEGHVDEPAVALGDVIG